MQNDGIGASFFSWLAGGATGLGVIWAGVQWWILRRDKNRLALKKEEDHFKLEKDKTETAERVSWAVQQKIFQDENKDLRAAIKADNIELRATLKAEREDYEDRIKRLQGEIQDHRTVTDKKILNLITNNEDLKAESEFQWRVNRAYKQVIMDAGIPVPEIE